MTRIEKENIISDMTEEFKSANAVVVCDYKGLTVTELEEIRNLAKQNDTKVRVVKNSLAKISMKEAGIDTLDLVNTNIFVWAEDQISACKVADKSADMFKEKFVIKSGLIEGKEASLSDIAAMAKLPSRDELIGMLLSVWTAPARNMVTGLDNLRSKLEEESA